ncbi:MAG: alpha/beta hydrolase [Rhizobiaceae bacterium]|nr:MAG: alpha/beta hydrolase [Rhizobiaceae bacterium]
MSRRTILRQLWAAGAAAPFLGIEVAAAQSATTIADEEYIARFVHPELRAQARQFAAMGAAMPPFTPASLSMMRKGMGAVAARKLAVPAIEMRQIPGRAGQPPVSIHVVNAKPGGHRPAIVHMHGGGYIMGDATQNLFDLQKICEALDCLAVSVDYRLAPETTYLGSSEDNYLALKWVHANAEQLGVDPARIAVMGESAGGGHAANLAILARDRGEVPVAFQCLIYPMIDDRTGSTQNPAPHIGRLLWTRERNATAWRMFLGATPGRSKIPAAAAPARVTNLNGLPPAFIGVGTLDLFYDEDVDFAQRLNAAGVMTELIVVPGAFHGFDAADVPVVQRFNAAKREALRRGLGIAPS